VAHCSREGGLTPCCRKVTRDEQEQDNAHTKSVGPEEDGTLSPRRQTQGSLRVTFALWVEDTGSEADEGRTKATVTRSERSLQCMEDASMAKQVWTQHLQATEAAAGAVRGLEQDLRQLRDKDRVQTLLSLLTRTAKGWDLTRGDVEGLLREGRDWIKNSMQPVCKRREVGEARPLGIFWKKPDAGGGH
jgi:hypothetical protein